MLDLATYYAVNKEIMERHVGMTVEQIGAYKDYVEHWPLPTYHFNRDYWAELARQTRGLPLIYDSFDEFWTEFKTWFDVRVYDYIKMLIAVHSEYHPLHNYDRTEEHTENVGRSGKKQTSGKERNHTTQNGRNSTTTKNTATVEGESTTQRDGTTEEESTTTNKVNGYNGEEMTVRDTEESSGKKTDAESVVATSKDSNSATTEGSAHYNSAADGYRDINSTEVDKEEQTTKRAIRAYGNIGVTTSQQMIESEIALRQNHVIKYMVSDFKKDFCIMVY